MNKQMIQMESQAGYSGHPSIYSEQSASTSNFMKKMSENHVVSVPKDKSWIEDFEEGEAFVKSWMRHHSFVEAQGGDSDESFKEKVCPNAPPSSPISIRNFRVQPPLSRPIRHCDASGDDDCGHSKRMKKATINSSSSEMELSVNDDCDHSEVSKNATIKSAPSEMELSVNDDCDHSEVLKNATIKSAPTEMELSVNDVENIVNALQPYQIMETEKYIVLCCDQEGLKMRPTTSTDQRPKSGHTNKAPKIKGKRKSGIVRSLYNWILR